MPNTQQEFLRTAAQTLRLSQKDFAKRMGAPWSTFENWLRPVESQNFREMPPIAWKLVSEILDHEDLKKKLNK